MTKKSIVFTTIFYVIAVTICFYNIPTATGYALPAFIGGAIGGIVGATRYLAKYFGIKAKWKKQS